MGILIKFVLKNIKENKFRTFLIIFSITLSAALFFASMAISDTVAEMYLKRVKSNFGSAEIMIHPDKDSPSSFFRTYKAEKFSKELEYVVGAINRGATYNYSNGRTIQVSLRGYRFEDLQKMNPINLEREYRLEPFQGRKVVIGQEAAEDYDLKLGDNLSLMINGRKYNFIIAGIAASRGLFAPQQGQITALIPREKLASLYGVRGRVVQIYIKTNKQVTPQQMIEKLSKEYDRYTVTETLTRKQMKEYTRPMTAPFKFMLPLVVLISVFIIYTSFKVITMERLPMLGTFRSVGATRKMTDFILLMESLIYGIIGGLVGCGLGLGILYVMKKVLVSTSFMEVQVDVQMVYSSWQLIASFLGAVILAVISSLIPIIAASKISVKDIVLNNIENKAEVKDWKLIMGVVVLILGIVLPFILPEEDWALLIKAGCILLIGTGIVLLVPKITNSCIHLFEVIYPYIFGNEGILAAKNLKDNKSIMNNIALLTIGVASLLMINIVSYSASTELVNVYGDADFEIFFTHSQNDRRIEGRVKAVKGVEDVYSVYRAGGVELANKEGKIGNIYGIDVKQYFNYWDFNLVGDKEEIFDDFSSKRSIIVTNTLKGKFELNKGDIITLETERGKKPYQVIGFVNTIFNGGNAAFASAKYFKRDMQLRYKGDSYIKTYQDSKEVNNRIKDKFSRENIWAMTVTDMQERETKMWSGLLTLLKGFSVITMLIGIFGIFNNFMVEFMSRKRILAIFRSVGMSKRQTLKMLFIEAITGGLIGGAVGCVGGWLFVILTEIMLKSINLALPMYYTPKMFVVAIISGIIISVLSSVSPALKSSKFNIIEAIKYE